jgi:hypothetical protein
VYGTRWVLAWKAGAVGLIVVALKLKGRMNEIESVYSH